MIIVTTTSAALLYKAKVMARSVKTYMPDAKVVTCLIERELYPFETENGTKPFANTPEGQVADLRRSLLRKGFENFDEVVLAKNMDVPDFDKLAFKHSALELSCLLKYYTMIYAMKKYPHEKYFVYLDSDMKVYGPFSEVLNAFEKHSIVLTPHRVEPDPWEHFLKDGTFNGGFFAVKRSEDGEKFLDWMTSRLRVKNYIDAEQGLFVDQKWLNLAPAYFDVHSLRHHGYNIAGWNLHESERKQISNIGGVYRVKDKYLRLIHFSGIGIFLERVLNDWFPTNKTHPLFLFLDEYKREWEEMGRDVIKDIAWSYDFFQSGERISLETRGKIKYQPELLDRFIDPFVMSNHHFNHV